MNICLTINSTSNPENIQLFNRTIPEGWSIKMKHKNQESITGPKFKIMFRIWSNDTYSPFQKSWEF